MASQFGPERLEYSTGGPIANQLISVRLRGSLELAELFSDASEMAGAVNPVMTDGDGQLVFFAAAGYYDLVFGGHVFPITVGTPGDTGGRDTLTFVQSSPVTPWVINWGAQLRTKPVAVKLVESTGDPMEAAWYYHPSVEGIIIVDFDAPTSGVAEVR